MINKEYINEERAYMKRALQLSQMGAPNVSPNPMVGAVIVAEGRIIGEGYHRIFGQAHAEVNAVNSVNEADRHLLEESSMYVTLEPCSHYGKTPPCAELIIRTGIPKVFVATEDPFLKNKESGIDKMRAAGVDVVVGLMREEALWINRRFFTAHTLKRPYILLKWAQSADGYMSAKAGEPLKFSTPFTEVAMHRERAMYDAIMVGTNTVLADNPRLSCRLWPCRNAGERPLKITFESIRLTGKSNLEAGDIILKGNDESLEAFLQRLYSEYGITSLMVEGGAKTLESFISEGLYDEIRLETANICIKEGVKAPPLPPNLIHFSSEIFGHNEVAIYTQGQIC